MKKKRYIPFIFALCCFWQVEAHAQQAARPAPGAEQQRIARLLSIPEQKAAEVVQVMAISQQEAQGILDDKKLATPAGQLRLKALLAERHARLGKLLTADQLARLAPPVPMGFQRHLDATKQKIAQLAGKAQQKKKD